MKKLILLALLMLGAKELFSSPPEWVTSIKKDSRNYYFVGYAEDIGELETVKDKALYNAKSKIASSIFEETEVTKVFSTFGEISGNEELQKSYKEEIKSKSIVQLGRIEIEDFYFEKVEEEGLTYYKVWLLARMSKSDFEKERNRIIEELKRKLELVDKNLKLGSEKLEEGEILEAINAYYTALLSSIQVKERMDEFPVYVNKINSVLNNITIELENSPENIDIDKGGKISFKIYYSNNKNKFAVKGARVNFILRNNKGEYNTQSISDENGIIICSIKSLQEVNDNTTIYAKLSLDFQELLGLDEKYKKFYSTVMDSVEKVSTSFTIKTVSSSKSKLLTGIVALMNSNKEIKPEINLASKAQEILVSRGYRVKEIPPSIKKTSLIELERNALETLDKNGFQRLLLIVVIPEEVQFNATLERYIGNYNLSIQLVETSSGEIVASKNKKITVTSTTKEGNLISFISSASKELTKMIK